MGPAPANFKSRMMCRPPISIHRNTIGESNVQAPTCFGHRNLKGSYQEIIQLIITGIRIDPESMPRD